MIRPEIEAFRCFLVRLLNQIYLGRLYSSNWGNDFILKETENYFGILERESLKIDIRSLSEEEREVLYFPKFDDSRWCIPAYMYQAALAQGLMTDKDDTDTRFGCFWPIGVDINDVLMDIKEKNEGTL